MKPVYTKEMHERGEWPPVGSIVNYCVDEVEVLINKPDTDGCIIIIMRGEYLPVKIDKIKPIPTIEDDVAGIIHQFCDELTFKDSNIAAKQILNKYNITPKDS